MGDSFSVDVAALGQIPSILEGARSVLTGTTRVGALAGAAATSAAPGLGAGIEQFGRALDLFVAAGAVAIGDDITNLQRAAAAYEQSDRRVVQGAGLLARQVGGGR